MDLEQHFVFTDTDSLCYNINTDDIYQDMMEDKHLFDTSEYNPEHRLYSTLNKGVRKDEVDVFKELTKMSNTCQINSSEFSRKDVMLRRKKHISNQSTISAGLPENLNDDSFIDSRYPSLIILDDLMRDVTNSKDVCELFVEGSHHRNLSVACILQNVLEGKGE
ncbi:unnamed protein product [Mytilus edulis]|uniref:Uncharacterized protein n=1 Tax=Mytilus edulis TaxID=6550 RepID=A0A8S3RNA1_MYTED|nr:unnamed protein product [Mytilus edulis]